ncbi:PGF-CTERM sorting domain-containing protein [Halosolutus amylolyticus]|uniref:PGF-CTERM sorting domain-containing protein n=1 Tax=Halosolutus amylolyticus TaxID=2932267 RepID=A0ABD5PSC1_9EURY|nr:PGF-CTERM sorting domain-containing protein [Halosolutus amylolyticus]
MKRESALLVAALVVAVAALTSLALSGAVTDPSAPDTEAAIDRAGTASLLEVTIAADEVSGETVTLAVDTYLQHEGRPVENVTVVHRTMDADDSLVVDVTEREVGTLESESEEVVPGTVDVPREGAHRIETIVYTDGTRTETVTHRVSGLDSLTPAYADTGLEFHSYTGALVDVPAIEYEVESTTDGRATLEVKSYLTNAGDETADDLELELKARQADSNIVADSATVDLSGVEPGETINPTAELEVPDEYAYHLDGILRLDGTIVATDRAGADLRPNATDGDALDTGEFDDDADENGFEASEADAESHDEAANGADDEYDKEDDASADNTPGFGVAVAAVALLATIAFARRSSNE